MKDKVCVSTTTDEQSADRLVIRVNLGKDSSERISNDLPEQPRITGRSRLFIILGAVAIVIAVVFVGIRLFNGGRAPVSTTAVVQPAPTVAPPAIDKPPLPEPASPPPSISEVIPKVAQSSLDTIRGTVKVVIRVNVGKDGKVVRASTRERGPSRYFERLALDAANKWTFEPAAANEQRIKLVRFNFRRSGVTASAETPN
jgi:TonB family protein